GQLTSHPDASNTSPREQAATTTSPKAATISGRSRCSEDGCRRAVTAEQARAPSGAQATRPRSRVGPQRRMAQQIAPRDGQLVRDLGGDELGMQVAVQVVDGQSAV